MRLCIHGIFFFKQKTAYELRISDWSSDVCSSDLQRAPVRRDGDGPYRPRMLAKHPGDGAGAEIPEKDVVIAASGHGEGALGRDGQRPDAVAVAAAQADRKSVG